jgi:hypothetical protein
MTNDFEGLSALERKVPSATALVDVSRPEKIVPRGFSSRKGVFLHSCWLDRLPAYLTTHAPSIIASADLTSILCLCFVPVLSQRKSCRATSSTPTSCCSRAKRSRSCTPLRTCTRSSSRCTGYACAAGLCCCCCIGSELVLAVIDSEWLAAILSSF